MLSSALVAGAVATAAPAQAAPTVNMEAVVKAAQWDPYKPDQSITPGAGDSVKAVEQALAAKDMLASRYVDGHFGTTTIDGYAKYQRSLGYSGLDASGLPGKTSLAKLGDGRYTLSNTLSVGARSTMDGETVNARTAAMIKEAEGKAGENLTLTQGSYTSETGASAGTHDGGGAVDISISGVSDVDGTVTALRQVGFAAWHRTPAQGFDHHIHAVAISDTDMSPEAQAQIGDYYKGLNGLAGHGADDGPQVAKVTWEEYKRS
ncbi:MAG: peptidoglycan-binding protein [Streptosporangiales bacterium]|nr:peptidoglycan-binding protein [Streptosporangiales bacterium]